MEEVLSFLPPLLLALTMLWRRYPGEELLARARARRRVPAPRVLLPLPAPRRPVLALPHHGSVLAWDVGGRAPPRGRRVATTR